MTPATCEKAGIGEVARLIDQRDQKIYWIGKMADNRCWMTQNLDFDLWDEAQNKAVTLTPDTSDVISDWVTSTGESEIWNTSDAPKYYDPGNKVYNGTEFQEVGDLNVSNDPQMVDYINESVYNAHYLQGNYYSAYATYDNELGTICPKGWTLPTSNRYQDYYNLIAAYGWGPIKGDEENWSIFSTYSILNGYRYDPVRSPFYFTLSGFVLNGEILDIGGIARYYAYNKKVFFLDRSGSPGDNRIGVSKTTARYGGPVRCIAR